MTDHTRAVRLTVTALDFTLTLEERMELEVHRVECVACRQVDLDLRSDLEALRRRPRQDAPSQLRQAIAEASWRDDQPRFRSGLLLVAAILMLAMAIGGGIAASQWLERDDDATLPTPTLGPLHSDLLLAEDVAGPPDPPSENTTAEWNIYADPIAHECDLSGRTPAFVDRVIVDANGTGLEILAEILGRTHTDGRRLLPHTG